MRGVGLKVQGLEVNDLVLRNEGFMFTNVCLISNGFHVEGSNLAEGPALLPP